MLCFVVGHESPAEVHRSFLFDFEVTTELNAARWECHQLLYLSAEYVTHGDSSLKIEMFPSGLHPGLKLVDFDLDWSNYNSFHFDAFNPQSDSVCLHIRIDDQDYYPEFADRFNSRVALPPGASHHVVHFDEVVTSGTNRRLDFSSIEKVYLFMTQPKEKTILYFDYLHLE
jgi:hypothetical protein